MCCELGVAGQGWGHTHTTLPPGNVRNLRSEVLRWGYHLSSDTRQLQRRLVNNAGFRNIKC